MVLSEGWFYGSSIYNNFIFTDYNSVCFLNSVLEKFGINSFEIFEQIMESAKAWLEANPETALKLGNTLKEIFNAIIEFAEKIN